MIFFFRGSSKIARFSKPSTCCFCQICFYDNIRIILKSIKPKAIINHNRFLIDRYVKGYDKQGG